MTPDRTAAVVVGVETYDGDPAHDVDGPAMDALRFAQWLVSRGVPQERVTLLVSPTEENRGVIERDWCGTVRDAQTLTVTGVLGDKTVYRDRDCLIVYWSGRGVDGGGGCSHVLFADTRQTQRTLSLVDLRRWLGTRRVGCPRQVLFVDSCRQFAHDFLRNTEPHSFLHGEPLKPAVDQAVMHSVGPGEFSFVRNGTTPFATALREELDAAPAGTWPPDHVALVAGLRARTDLAAPVLITTTSRRGDVEPTWVGPLWLSAADSGREVAKRLNRVPAMTSRRRRAEVARFLDKELDAFPLADGEATVIGIAYTLAGMAGGWSALCACLARFNDGIFPPRDRAVMELRALLDALSATEAGERP